MAAQLRPRRMPGLLASGTSDMHIPARVLTAACITVVLLCIVSLIVATRTASRDQEAALQRYTDTQALLALPPVDLDALQAERDAAMESAAAAEALLQPPSVDPTSDAATAMLVARATAAGLAVQGINRVPPGEVKDGTVTYDVEGLRIIVEGQAGKIIGLLVDIGRDEPGFIPTLTSMTVNDRAVARAEITFNVYTKVPEPTPVVPAGAVAR